VKSADKVWLTCCALHNWLLEIDGLDEHWDLGILVDWERELGQIDQQDLDQYVIPFACRRLNNPSLDRRYDTSGMGHGIDRIPNRIQNDGNDGDVINLNDINVNDDDISVNDDDVNDDDINVNDDDVNRENRHVQLVRNLSMVFFRERLI
jgi:hypothetical protein